MSWYHLDWNPAPLCFRGRVVYSMRSFRALICASSTASYNASFNAPCSDSHGVPSALSGGSKNAERADVACCRGSWSMIPWSGKGRLLEGLRETNNHLTRKKSVANGHAIPPIGARVFIKITCRRFFVWSDWSRRLTRDQWIFYCAVERWASLMQQEGLYPALYLGLCSFALNLRRYVS